MSVGQQADATTSRPKAARQRKSTEQTARVYTVGYEGRDLAGLVTLLSDHCIETLVDVRLTPISRKRGFSKTALSAALSDAGITYVHERRLGNPKDNRPAYRAGEQVAQRRYLKHLTHEGADALALLGEMVAGSVTALLCVEKEAATCHRSAIALQLGMPTVSL